MRSAGCECGEIVEGAASGAVARMLRYTVNHFTPGSAWLMRAIRAYCIQTPSTVQVAGGRLILKSYMCFPEPLS